MTIPVYVRELEHGQTLDKRNRGQKNNFSTKLGSVKRGGGRVT